MKRITTICAALALTLGLAACGDASQMEQDVKKTVDDTAEKARDAGEQVMDDSKRTLDDMMDHLRENQTGIDQEEAIDDIPFAAYDGRSFQVEGNTLYLYRIDPEDEEMKRISEQLALDSMVNVERNGQKMQYNGTLYEDYLLLYEPGVNADAIIDAMNSYGN